ncbi:hypothetical protein GCM10010273_20620 [Streptomyces lavendulocolor]
MLGPRCGIAATVRPAPVTGPATGRDTGAGDETGDRCRRRDGRRGPRPAPARQDVPLPFLRRADGLCTAERPDLSLSTSY